MGYFRSLVNSMHQNQVLKHRHYLSDAPPSSGYIQMRFFASLLMLIIALIGVILTDFSPHFSANYWFYAIPVFAVINIILSWHAALGHRQFVIAWHELLHWLALLVCIFMVYIFVHMGVFSNVLAGIFMLTLLALTTFLAGIHFDSMLIIIGIILMLFDLLSAVFVQFSMVIVVPIVVVAAILIFWRVKDSRDTRTSDAHYHDNIENREKEKVAVEGMEEDEDKFDEDMTDEKDENKKDDI
jgi:hypothetical protein